jgi:hypothetical protein
VKRPGASEPAASTWAVHSMGFFAMAALPNLGFLPPGYFASWSSLAFCRI